MTGLGRTRVLVVTNDFVGREMAGPAIRSFELSRVLASEFDVVLATRHPPQRGGDGFAVRSYSGDGRLLRPLVDWCDVLVAFGPLLRDHPWLARAGKWIVADLYDPEPLEVLALSRADPPLLQARRHRDARVAMNHLIAVADFVICASDRQRDFLLGAMTALGRVNPITSASDPTLERLIAAVPFGMPGEPPKPQTTSPLRGTHGGIGADDVVLIWGGGIYDWLDPLTLIEGVAQRGSADVKLFFMGLTHPTPEVAPAAMAGAAVALAERLELKDRVVFFNQGWVPYDQRSGFLLDSDVGVSTHLRHVEATYAFRTRVVDYIWARLPILCSAGDTLADLVADRDLGEVVPVGDATAIAAAVDRLCDPGRRRACSERLDELAEDLNWDKVCGPLVEFCRDPGRAPDLAAPEFHAWHWARVHAALAGLRERVARTARGARSPGIWRGKVFTEDE